MGEWKRIYGSPKRLLTIGLVALLSVAFFFIGRMDFFGRGSITALVEGERYYADVVSRLRGRSAEEIDALLSEEDARVKDCTTLLSWGDDEEWLREFFDTTREELLENIGGNPILSSYLDLEDNLRIHMLIIAGSRVDELIEQFDYIAGYADYLDSIQLQAERQSQTALFGDENSFSHRNLVRTAEEFDTLRDVEVSFGANRAYESWIDYELADYLYLLLIVIFVFAFLEERQAGLWGMIRCCRGGRGRLGLQRVAILASASVLGVALIYGVSLLISLTLSGGWGDMGRSIQSLLMFRTLTMRVSIGQWIVQYLLVKAVSGFMVGLLLWCLLGTMANVQLSLSVLCVTLAAEYALFAFLPVQSIFNPVKYFNLFSYIRTSKLYTEYLNINLLNYPFGIRRLALIWLPIFTLAFFAWTMWIQCLRRPDGNRDVLSVIAGGWDRFMDFFRRHLSIGGWEVYKTMIFQWGLPILLVVYPAGGSLSYYQLGSSPQEDAWYQAYIADIAGPIDDSIDDYFVFARANAAGNAELLRGIDQAEARVEALRTRAAEGGYRPWVVTSASVRYYDSVYGEASRDVQRLNAAVAMVFLILCCAALSAFEHQSGVVFMLRSLKRGRRGVFARKLLTAAVMTALVWAIVYVPEFYEFVRLFRPVDMAAPIGNFDVLSYFPLPSVSIGQYMSMVYILRFVMLYLLAMVIMFISERVPTVELSYIVNIVLLGLPAILFALGIDFLRYVSPVIAVSSAEELWSLASTGSYTGLIPCVILLAIGLAALVLNWRKWVGTKDHAVHKKGADYSPDA